MLKFILFYTNSDLVIITDMSHGTIPGPGVRGTVSERGRPYMEYTGEPSFPFLVTRGGTKWTGPGLSAVLVKAENCLCLVPNENAGLVW